MDDKAKTEAPITVESDVDASITRGNACFEMDQCTRNENSSLIEGLNEFIVLENTMADFNYTSPLSIDGSLNFTEPCPAIENQEIKEQCPQEEKTHKFDGIEPFDGMEFESLEEAHEFYHSYAKVSGFSARIRVTQCFPKTEEKRYRRYVCSCEGFCSEKKSNDEGNKKEKKTLTCRSGCPVTFSVSRELGKKQWIASKVNNKHNHLLASPRSKQHVKKQKIVPSLAKDLVEKFNEIGLPTGKVADLLNDEPGVNISNRDCWNHMRNFRLRNLDIGDAEAVFQYCKTKQAQDPNFYYSILPDNESRMVNFFWVDSRARLYYERFGDVVVFDTTYKTNKYSMPLALFVGVNHHGQSILFGCALLQDEREESFEWLFTTWLDAMHGKTPISILTDQDAAIGNMVKKVFPSTTHRLCLWHIMKKFPEKYGNLYKKKSPFKKDIKRCLYQTITTEEFDKEWKEILSRYNLVAESWLQHLFQIRRYWVPVYNRTIFFAGMNTTQRCESMHSFFDSFVHSGTTLREFVSKYDQALARRYKDENREHYASKHLKPVPKIRPPISDHAATVYTRNIFNLFEDEVLESLRLTKKKLEKVGSHCKYEVSNGQNPNHVFVVSIDSSQWDVSCECHLFEFKGILCRHILAVFHKKDVQKIPSKYILPRWTKEAADGIPVPLKMEAEKSAILRTMHFYQKTNLLLPYLHESDEVRQVIMDAMDEAYQKVLQLMSDTTEATHVQESQTETACSNLRDPKVSNTKGRKRDAEKESSNGRLRSGFEIAMDQNKKRQIRCRGCGGLGHNISTCKKV